MVVIPPAGLEPATFRLEGGGAVSGHFGRLTIRRDHGGLSGAEPPEYISTKDLSSVYQS
jgi:hypothetical protein